MLQAEFSIGLVHLGRVWRRRVGERIAAFGLSEATAMALLSISRTCGGLRQGEIAEILGIVGPSLVRLLDQLCSAGLVRRCEDCRDRRAKTVSLTPTGRALAREIEAVLAQARAEFLDGVSAADLEACQRVFGSVATAIECRLPKAAPVDVLEMGSAHGAGFETREDDYEAAMHP